LKVFIFGVIPNEVAAVDKVNRQGRIAERIEGFQLSEAPVLEAKIKALLAAR